jgi:hypothetical protein
VTDRKSDVADGRDQMACERHGDAESHANPRPNRRKGICVSLLRASPPCDKPLFLPGTSGLAARHDFRYRDQETAHAGGGFSNMNRPWRNVPPGAFPKLRGGSAGSRLNTFLRPNDRPGEGRHRARAASSFRDCRSTLPERVTHPSAT